MIRFRSGCSPYYVLHRSVKFIWGRNESGLREPQQGGGGIFIVCLGPSNSLFGRTRRKKKVIWDVPRHARDQRDDSETRRNAFATFFTASVLKCSILPPPLRRLEQPHSESRSARHQCINIDRTSSRWHPRRLPLFGLLPLAC